MKHEPLAFLIATIAVVAATIAFIAYNIVVLRCLRQCGGRNDAHYTKTQFHFDT